MVTKPLPRIYLKEHREAHGVSAQDMADRLGIERESVYRLEKRHWGVSSEKQAAYAAALKIQPEDLWRRPDDPSLDQIISRAPRDVQESFQTLLKRLLPQRQDKG
jgi:transcriptional regulator with XRE-family HTH domain